MKKFVFLLDELLVVSAEGFVAIYKGSRGDFVDMLRTRVKVLTDELIELRNGENVFLDDWRKEAQELCDFVLLFSLKEAYKLRVGVKKSKEFVINFHYGELLYLFRLDWYWLLFLDLSVDVNVILFVILLV